jgi:hypothetical protein
MTAPHAMRLRRIPMYFGLTASLSVTAAFAQVTGGAMEIDASGNYQHEIQSCQSGMTQQDPVTCMKEARNAQADRKRGVLDNANSQFEANSLARCEAQSGEDKAACQARMMGYGTASGSVAAGGLLREVETVVLPAGASSVIIEPKTADPVVLVPAR